MCHGQLLISRVTGHLPYQDFTCTVIALIKHLKRLVRPDLESYLIAGEQDQSQDVSAGSIKLDRN